MSFISSLLRSASRNKVRDERHRHSIQLWRDRPKPDRRQRIADSRFVVVDVETTGLDIRLDRLISIGACCVERGAIALADTLEVVLRQPAPSADENILVHRIGGSEQLNGVEPADALIAFLEFAGHDPLVGFNADFDHVMIDRALDDVLGVRTDSTWFDVSPLARALLPARHPGEQSLDAWCGIAGIGNYRRHSALADALATAQLLMVVIDAAPSQRIETIAGLEALERGQRWLEKVGGR